MIISVDHGNKQIKTTGRTFTSGLAESENRPPIGEDILQYNGRWYSLSEQRIPYMRNKCTDERFYILTLFAIAFEIEAAGHYPGADVTDIQLLVGLPPAHFGALYEKFEHYFTRKGLAEEFVFRGRPHCIHISRAVCFPQAYAAAKPVYSRMASSAKSVIIDIGGFTADYLAIKNGRAVPPGAPAIDTDQIEAVVRRILNEGRNQRKEKKPQPAAPTPQEIGFDDAPDAALPDELHAIAEVLSAFRQR